MYAISCQREPAAKAKLSTMPGRTRTRDVANPARVAHGFVDLPTVLTLYSALRILGEDSFPNLHDVAKNSDAFAACFVIVDDGPPVSYHAV